MLALVDRETKQVRTFVVNNVRSKTLAPILRENIAKEARLMTDDASYYTKVGREFSEHGVVKHSQGEYVDGDAHTNTLEGYFSIFKRGMKGVYQHCGRQHLHRYVAEFEFRYNHRSALGENDTDRAAALIKAAEGRRLTYRRPDAQASA